nr:uncharacterized protein LOC104111260 [Nicotiana tomentosiformis]
MWDKLEVTYEGTSKVKETPINMLVHDYELFQMKEGESIEEMFASIREDPSQENKPGRKEENAFKATTEGLENDIDDDSEVLEEEITMVSRNMDGLMRRYGHVQAECPDLKRKVSRGFNKNKSFGSWSYEDNSEHKEIANMCFMTILKNDMNIYSGCWTDENALDDGCKEDTKNYFMARGKTREEHHRKSRKEKWYLDSARSSHMSGDKNLFKEVTKINGGNVKFGDDSRGKIVGTVTVPFSNNYDITEVYLVDGLNYNFLSISQLCDSGYEVKFKKTICAIENEAEESVHIIFDDNNSMTKKGDFAGDEEINQNQPKNSEQKTSEETTNKTIEIPQSTNEGIIEHDQPQNESTNQRTEKVPNEWRSEREYPQKFIIGNPIDVMKTRGGLKKKANIALISQIKPKKVDEALKDSS